MKLELELSEAQVKELVKMIYLSGYVVGSSGKHSKGHQYPNLPVYESTEDALFKAIFNAFPDCDLLRVDRKDPTKITLTNKIDDDTATVIYQYNQYSILESIVSEISVREYEEQYGMELECPSEIFDIIYDANMKWLEENGIGNLVIPSG